MARERFCWPAAVAFCAAVPVLLLVSCTRGESSKDKSAAAGGSNPGAVEVSTFQAVGRRLPVVIQATGGLSADESADVTSEVDGTVVATPVDVGRLVRRGDVLFRLDDRTARLRLDQAVAAEHQAEAALRQAEARLGLNPGAGFEEKGFDLYAVAEVAAARAQYESARAQSALAESDEQRYSSLLKSGDIARSLYDQASTRAKTAREQATAASKQYESALNGARQATAALAAARAALEAARAQAGLARKAFEDTTIKAPFSGYVSLRNVSAGEYISMSNRSTKIVRVVQIDPIKLQLQLPETEAGRLRLGLPVTAAVQAHPRKTFAGKVTAVNPAVNPATRAITVEAILSNPEGLLLPGMFATGMIEQAQAQEAVFVPRLAVLADPNTDSYRLFVIQGDRARLRTVQIGAAEGELVRIASGVSAGETVATDNQAQLYDGAPVRPRPKG